MVFQHFSLFEALTVVENIALAVPGRFDLRALAERVESVSAEYGLPLEPNALVADLPVGYASASKWCAACSSNPPC